MLDEISSSERFRVRFQCTKVRIILTREAAGSSDEQSFWTKKKKNGAAREEREKQGVFNYFWESEGGKTSCIK